VGVGKVAARKGAAIKADARCLKLGKRASLEAAVLELNVPQADGGEVLPKEGLLADLAIALVDGLPKRCHGASR
jgi:hypothetical protein